MPMDRAPLYQNRSDTQDLGLFVDYNSLAFTTMAVPVVTPAAFLAMGNGLLDVTSSDERAFRAHYGTGPLTCSRVWTMCIDAFPRGVLTMHLLWALLFLKIYETEDVLCRIAKTSRKTFRKWSWSVVKVVASKLFFMVRTRRGRANRRRKATGTLLALVQADFETKDMLLLVAVTIEN
jgi:hypothetical protein